MAQRIAESATWANSAAAGTEVVIAGSDDQGLRSGDAVVMVHNPSTVTALTVTPRVRLTDRTGTQRVAAIAGGEFTVPANSTQSRKVSGLIGVPDLSIKNATVLGAADGFTAQVVIHFAP